MNKQISKRNKDKWINDIKEQILAQKNVGLDVLFISIT